MNSDTRHNRLNAGSLHGGRRACVSDVRGLGLGKLHIDALQFDYPVAGSKAFGNKLLCCWAAHFLSDARTCLVNWFYSARL